MSTNILFSESDRATIQEIKGLEKEYEQNELKLRQLQAEIDFKKSKLNISWIFFILECLDFKDFYALKTPIQVANCIESKFGFSASREIKNAIATTLSNMFNDGKVGRITINNKSYYGIPKYFDDTLEKLNEKYYSFIEGRKRNP